LSPASTNWSVSGVQLQDNQLTLHRSAIVAAEYRSVLDLNHTAMLKQMVARTILPSPTTAAH